MVYNDIISYLSGRINTVNFLNEDSNVISAYFNTSSNLLNTYYNFSELEDVDVEAMIIGEEAIFLFNGNLDLEPYYEYNALTSFNVAGAIQGSVDYDIVKPYFSNFVKGLLEANGIDEKISDPTSNLFQSFATV